MPNHIHLVHRERTIPVGQSIQKILLTFISWYNRKYDRVGHLFQDRFRSEPIETSEYLLKAVRYVHMNPVKAALCKNPGDYPYSSYSYYFHSRKYSDGDIILNLMRKDEFEKFHFETNEDHFLDIDESDRKKFSDADFAAVVSRNSLCQHTYDIRFLPEEERFQLIRILMKSGADIPQISRMTRMTVNEIKRAIGE